MRFAPVRPADGGRKARFYAGRASRRNVAVTAASSRDLKMARLLTPFCFPIACSTGSVQSVQSRASVTRINGTMAFSRSEEHTSELQSLRHLVCRLLLSKTQ